MIRGSLSSIFKSIISTFGELRKTISTFISNVLPSASKNSGSKTPRQQSSHKAKFNPSRTYRKVKPPKHKKEAERRAAEQGLGVEKELVKLVNRLGNKSKETDPQSGKRPRRRQSSLPRGRGGIFNFWN